MTNDSGNENEDSKPIAGSVADLKEKKGGKLHEDTREYDMVVVGAGCAGYSAAIYAARFNMSTLVIGKEKGGLITTTHLVENYPPLGSVSGPDMMDMFADHVEMFDIPIMIDTVTDIQKEGDKFSVETEHNGSYMAKTVVIATGTKHRKLGVPGEKRLANKGVSYCATCDAAFFKDKEVAIVGGSDSAAKEAILLTEHCEKVYIIYRGEEIRPEPVNGLIVEDLVEKGKIEIINNTNVTEINGEDVVESVTLDNEYQGSRELELSGVFIEIGGIPQSDLAAGLGAELNEKDEIIIDKESNTNVPGVYAAGDVCETRFKQAIIGAAEGTFAAYSAYNYLQS